MLKPMMLGSFLFLILSGCSKEETANENPFENIAGQYQWLFTESRWSNSDPFHAGNSNQYYISSPDSQHEVKSIIIQFDGTFQLYLGDSLAYENSNYEYTYYPESGSVLIDININHTYFPYVNGPVDPWFFSEQSEFVTRSGSFATNSYSTWFREHWIKVL